MNRNVLAVCLTGFAAAGTASVQAQEAPSPYALAPSAGIVVMGLPDIETGVLTGGTGTFDPDVGGLGIGLDTGFNMATRIGKVDGNDIVVGLTLTGTFASHNASAKDIFTGPGVVMVNSYSAPTATINLTTSSNGAASTSTVNVSGTDAGGTANINLNQTSATASSNISSQDFSPTGSGSGAAFTAMVTQGLNSAAAYGGVATSTGATFIGVGDLNGLTVTTGVSESIFQTGADITFGLGGGENGTYLQGYVGPSIRYMGRNLDNSVTVDIPEPAGHATIPNFSVNRYEDLNTTYYGGLVGLSMTQVVDPSLSFTLSAEGGVYGYAATYTGSEKFNIPNGAGGLFSIDATTKQNEQANGIAWFARAQAATTLTVSQNTALTFAGSLGYLSRVPTITRSNNPAFSNTQTGDDATLTYNSTAGSGDNAGIGFGSMWNFGVSASLTTSF